MAKFNAAVFSKQIEKKLEDAVSQVLENDVAPELINQTRAFISDRVYNTYTPIEYERRKNSGGLLDYDNFECQVSGTRLVINNITSPNDSIFGTPFHSDPLLLNWMDEGSIAMLPGVSTSPWIKQRKGIKQLLYNNLLARGKIKKNIKSGLKRELKSK